MSRSSRPNAGAPAESPRLPAEPEVLRVRGARVHNLQDLSVDIPRDRLVVITGLSGSGKSSLAFDTVYAEGQRQYIESLSTYARQFFHQLERPDVDLIEGLQPTISIDQRAGSHNPRSTVATVTEIYDYLRLLMARVGQPHCYHCGASIRQQSSAQIVEDVFRLPEGTKFSVLSPLVRGRKGQHEDVLAAARKAGFLKVRIDGEYFEVAAPPELARQKKHHIAALVDRLYVHEKFRTRLGEAIHLALKHGEGMVLIVAGDEEKLYSTTLACPDCQISYEELEPRSFSFNSPYGACPACEGLGTRVEFDPELVLPDAELSLAAGAILPWRTASPAATRKHRAQLAGVLQATGAKWNEPLARLTPQARETLLRGAGEEHPGVLALLEQELAEADDEAQAARLTPLQAAVTCSACGGARLRPEARSVTLGGHALHQITALTLRAAREFFNTLPVPHELHPVADPLLAQIRNRLDFLLKVGLDYLTLDRSADSLSGGESQRIRLATAIGSGLVGVCYILDEPSIGLHPRDNQRLIDALRDLQRQGNSVLVVEHDEALMREADQILDLGPGPGRLGGRIVAQGTPTELLSAPGSLTGDYLAGRRRIGESRARRRVSSRHAIALEQVTTNNLKGLNVQFPLAALVCVTGVSGSGKSSLLMETLSPAVQRRLGRVARKPGPHTSLRGVRQINQFVEIDQSPIGRNPRSNPATYCGLFDEIRKVFAGTREAKLRGYTAGRFSFNVKGGRCDECQGQGQQRIEMNFLPDLYVTCPVCGGARFNRQTLQVRYRNRTIADVLEMSVEEAREFFENFPAVSRILEAFWEVGLGYLPLGQSSLTLSGGEAQRIKLATELCRPDAGNTLYLLDEPTTGLHFEDIRRLLAVLHSLVDRGNSVIVIEHNLDVIQSADWIIDLGPEGGEAGGYLLATGTPEEIAALEDNATGRFLRAALTAAQVSPAASADTQVA